MGCWQLPTHLGNPLKGREGEVMSRQGGKLRPSKGVDPCAVFGGQALDSDCLSRREEMRRGRDWEGNDFPL